MSVSASSTPAVEASEPDRSRLRWGLALGVFVIAALAAAAPALTGSVAPLATDSESYLIFSPLRTAGYPLFLMLTGVTGALVVQPLLAAAALGYLAAETERLTGRLWLALAVALAVALNPEFDRLHAVILTESLAASLLLIMLGLAMRFVRQATPGALALVSLAAGLSAAVRPGAYAMLPVRVLLAMMMRRRWPGAAWRMMLAAMLPMLAVVAAERLYTGQVHGAAATSLAGRHFYAKAAMIDAPATALPEDAIGRVLGRAIDDRFAPVRALIAAAPDDNIRRLLTVHYESCAQYVCIQDLRNAAGGTEVALNAVALRIAFARMAAAPGAYARLTVTHLTAMWTLYSQSHPALAPGFAAFVDGHRPLPMEDRMPGLFDRTVQGTLAIVARPAFIAIGLLTALLAVAGVVAALTGRAPPMLAAAMTAALSVHLTLLLTVGVGLGLARYMIALWPATVVALGLLAGGAMQAITSRRRAG